MSGSTGRGVGPGTLIRAIGRLLLLVGFGFGTGLVIGVAMEEPRLLLGHLRGEGESVRLVDAPFVESNADSSRVAAAEADAGSGSEGKGVGESSSAREARSTAGTSSQSGGDLAAETNAPSGPGTREAQRLALRASESASSDLPAVAARAPEASSGVSGAGSEARGSGNSSSDPRSSPQPEDTTRWAIQVGAFSDERVAIGLVDQLTAKRYPVDLLPSPDKKHRFRVRIQPIRGKVRAQAVANRLKREDGLPTWLIPLESDGG